MKKQTKEYNKIEIILLIIVVVIFVFVIFVLFCIDMKSQQDNSLSLTDKIMFEELCRWEGFAYIKDNPNDLKCYGGNPNSSIVQEYCLTEIRTAYFLEKCYNQK